MDHNTWIKKLEECAEEAELNECKVVLYSLLGALHSSPKDLMRLTNLCGMFTEECINDLVRRIDYGPNKA